MKKQILSTLILAAIILLIGAQTKAQVRGFNFKYEQWGCTDGDHDWFITQCYTLGSDCSAFRFELCGGGNQQ